MKILRNIKKCRICSSSSIELVLKLKKTPIGENFKKKKTLNNKKYNLDLYQCKNCGLAQLKQVINPNILYKNYLYQSNTSTDLNSHFRNYANDVLKYLKIKDKIKIVDIGSNDGTLLYHFKKLGHLVAGVEPARKISFIANQKKIFTINSFFKKSVVLQIIKKLGHPKIVTANNVLANVDNVNYWIKNVRMLIKDKGVFVFESFSLLHVIKNKVIDFIYHEHLSIFSVRSVLEICKMNNLKLIHVQIVNTKGGSLRYFISSINNNLDVNRSVNKFLSLEFKSKIYAKKTFLTLSNFLDYNRLRVTEIIKKKLANKAKRNLIGVGASISCITLLYQLKLEEKLKYLVDDNNLKNRMYSPGTNIPVIKTSEFQFSHSDILVVLAWRFKKKIFSKHQKNIKGSILEVWPRVSFVNLKKIINKI
jgi:hypothetical protein